MPATVTASRATLVSAIQAAGEDLRATDDPARQTALRGRLAGLRAELRAAAPRYIGSLTEVHGEVVAVRPCVLPCCIDLPEWEHPHASLTVYPDAGGSAVRLDRVRFESFTGRP